MKYVLERRPLGERKRKEAKGITISLDRQSWPSSRLRLRGIERPGSLQTALTAGCRERSGKDGMPTFWGTYAGNLIANFECTYFIHVWEDSVDLYEAFAIAPPRYRLFSSSTNFTRLPL
jgi:hypothetical protein